jgi:penicillin-binding protein 1A
MMTNNDPGPAARVADFWRERPRWQRITAISLLALAVFLGVAWHMCFFQGCPDVRKLASYQPGGAPEVLDRNGKKIADLAPVEGQLVRLLTLPPYVPEAFIAVEDQRFREHGAIDLRRVLGALVADIKAGGADEGSSTLTMQLARNLFPERIRGRERTLMRKLLEVRVAREIESEFDKNEILELYLNHIYFGDGARGVEAAARHYFGVPASGLTIAQAALLAALPKGPSAYHPRRHPDKARERRDLVLSLMAEQKKITPQQAAEAKAQPLGVVRRTASKAGTGDQGIAPYFVEEVRREIEDQLGTQLYEKPLRITTTLDQNAQRAAEEELERQLRAVESGAVGAFKGPRYDPTGVAAEEGSAYLQGAVVAIEPKTGDVLAWVGGRDFRQSRFDRVAISERQTGSAFKPFVYAAALLAGHTMAEVLSDQPLTLNLGGRTTWSPKNFDGTYADRITMRDALVHSKNIATVRLAQEVGVHNVATLAESAGIAPPIDEQPSMALGTVAVSPLELVSAYTTFANLGDRVDPRLVTKVEDVDGNVLWAPEVKATHVLDPGVAYIVTDVLKEVITRGSAASVRQAGFQAPAAGKTGTTNDGTDTWFVGYTPDVLAGVWIGFDKPQPIVPRATGGKVAAPVWARMMQRILAGRPRSDWTPPPGLTTAYVDASTGFVLASGCVPTPGAAAYKEVFQQSRLPTAVCPSSGQVDPSLVAGMNGLAMDSEEQIDAGLAPLPGAQAVSSVPDEERDGSEAHSYAAPPSAGEPAATAGSLAAQPRPTDGASVPSYGNQPPMPGAAPARRPTPAPAVTTPAATPAPATPPPATTAPAAEPPPDDEPAEDASPPPF